MVGERALLGEMVTCPDCNEVFYPAPYKSKVHVRTSRLEPPPVNSNTAERISLYIISALIVSFLGISLWDAKKAEGPKEKSWKDFADEAKPLMLEKATNQIVGFRRTLSSYIDDHGDYKNPNIWTGEVEAEYINSVGGVDVTNVPYKFNLDSLAGGEVYLNCDYDYRKACADDLARRLAQYKEALKNAGTSP